MSTITDITDTVEITQMTDDRWQMTDDKLVILSGNDLKEYFDGKPDFKKKKNLIERIKSRLKQ